VSTVTDNDCSPRLPVPSRNAAPDDPSVTANESCNGVLADSRNGNAAKAAAKYRKRRIEWAGSSGIDSFLGPLPQTEEEWARKLDAHVRKGCVSLSDASFCGACLRDLESDEPITPGGSLDPVLCPGCTPIQRPDCTQPYSPCDNCARPTAYRTYGRRQVIDWSVKYHNGRRHYVMGDYVTRTYCCDRCQYAFYRKRRRQRSLEEREERHCSVCDKVLTDQRGDAVYCSSSCRQRAYRRRKANA
jgi:hypothetical protein